MPNTDDADPPVKKISEVHRIRFRNYQALRARHREIEQQAGIGPERGEMARFGEKCKIERHYMSHISCGRKPIGHAVAKKMEVAFGMPEGWMDVDHAGGTLVMDQGARDFASLAMRLYLRDPDGVRAALMAYMEKKLVEGG